MVGQRPGSEIMAKGLARPRLSVNRREDQAVVMGMSGQYECLQTGSIHRGGLNPHSFAAPLDDLLLLLQGDLAA
jgi:hypothetical protein